MTARVAPSLAGVEYSRIRELAELALPMEGVLRLYFGESNLPTPGFIKEAAARALADGYTFYSENAGLPSLRAALAAKTAELHGVELDPASELVVTASGVQALHMAIRAVLDPGDEAIVLSPVWPNGPASVRMAGAHPVELPHPFAGGRFGLDLDALEAAVTPRTRLLLVTSPSNPLGWVATVEEQRALLELARRHGLWLVADEVYERLWYAAPGPGQPAPSILRLATREDAVAVVHSFSKTYCMTGWRVGWLVARRDLALRIGQLNEYVVSHAATFAQKAAEVALADGEPWIRELVGQLRRNRDLCLAALRSLPGVTVPEPEGAFYLFPRVEFGPGGEGSLRLCYAAEPAVLEPALERLAAFLERRR